MPRLLYRLFSRDGPNGILGILLYEGQKVCITGVPVFYEGQPAVSKFPED